MRALLIGLLLLLPAGGHAPSASAPASTSTLAITDVSVVPMDSERVLPHQTVLVRGDRIVTLGPVDSVAVPAGATRIDGSGRWLMPGLIDMHVHIHDDDDGTLYVANGVTTIRNMWGTRETLDLREQYRSGRALGPTIYTTGPILDGNPPIWPMSTVIENATQAEKEIAAEKAAGYDFVKVYSRLTREAYRGILEAARRHAMRVVGHVPDSVGLGGVLEARGQESIEHLTGYLMAAQPDDSPAFRLKGRTQRRAMAANVDDRKIGELARRTREAGTWNCVTLIVTQRFSQLDHYDSLRDLPETGYASPGQIARWNPANDFRVSRATEDDYVAMRAVCAFQMRMTKALRDSGARILLGTDTSNPFVVAGFAAHRELDLLVRAGLSPYEALRAGTADAAEFLHASAEMGRVSPRLRADLVLLDANPLEDVRAAALIRGVVLRGRWLPANELQDALHRVGRDRMTETTRGR